MDFRSRLNSCGRFSTDENFRNIIKRNSCRLRQNSVIPPKELYNNTESNKKINNISVVKKQNNKGPYLTKRESEIIEIKDKKEEIISSKNENKTERKYLRHKSDLFDKNYDNKKKPTLLNQLFFYQDIRTLKLSKNNKIENKLTSLEDLEKILDNNIDNFNTYNTTQKKKKINKMSKIDDNTQDDIKKNNTINNHSTKKRRYYLLNRIKKEINNNIINNNNNDTKNKININNFFEKQINKKLIIDSFYTNNNIYSTEKNNSTKKLNLFMAKENNRLYKKPQKLNDIRKKYIHNSISLFPAAISKIDQCFTKDDDKNEEKKIEDNNNKSTSDNSYIEEFINNFFCELIDLSNGMEEKSIFDILVNNLNKKYILNYKSELFPISSIKFVYCFKYFCTLITPLLFLSKDYDLYKYDSVKGRLFFNHFIFSSICYIGQDNFDITKIQNFIKKMYVPKEIPIIDSTISIIKLIFEEKQEYEPLKNALIQLVKNIINETVDNVIKILNNTILFCHNNKSKERMYYPFYRKRKQNQFEENSKMSESSPPVPFIKSSMKKEFCLVLDIDETISHSMKLSCGYYFLLRPGAIDFLNELSNYYEIDIFTSSLKLYADFIIDKIDACGKLISYRLYKNHVTYEKGKSIKNLSKIGRDLNKIIFVDNLKSNAKYNLKNLCHISSWKNDIYDEELIKLKNKLKYIATSGKYNDDITKGIN